jgi:hypothetical protein
VTMHVEFPEIRVVDLYGAAWSSIGYVVVVSISVFVSGVMWFLLGRNEQLTKEN